MPEVRLTETITVTEHEISDEERLLARKYNQLVERCLEWATLQMHHGLPATRLALTKSVLSSASRLAALDTKTHQQEQRLALQSLFNEMVAVDALEAPALTEPTLDQD